MLGKRRKRPLLPIDQQIMEALGLSEAQYRQYEAEAARTSRTRPAEGPQAALPVLAVIAINLAISAALSAATYLLTPRLKRSSGPPNARQEIDQRGADLVSRTEFTARSGISSSQNTANIGSTIPVVWAKRETIDGVTYGGVRVNCTLLWSQMISLGGSQMLRAIYMVGEAPIAGIDPSQIAFGENLLSSLDPAYDSESSARTTIYHRPGGGRIRATDRVAGRLAPVDPGNAEANGGADVFQVRGLNNEWVSATSYCYSPTGQTTFGVYSPIGNGLAYRVSPVLRPATNFNTVPAPRGYPDHVKIQCSPDNSALVQRQKNDSINQSRAGLTVHRRNGSVIISNELLVGDEIDYTLDSETSAAESFTSGNYSERKSDIAAAVGGRQRQWDGAIAVGDVYRIGSALATCKSRSPSDDVFRSSIESQPIGGGVSVTATFQITSAGVADFPGTSGTRAGTAAPHILRYASATIAIAQPAQVIEVNGKSSVGIRVAGFCNIQDAPNYYRIDLNACLIWDTMLLQQNELPQTTTFQNGSTTLSETRYTFWRFRYRIAGSGSAWSQFPQLFGVSGSTQQAQFWWNRIEFPSRQRWEFSYLPVSGWEVRSGVASGDLVVIDARLSSVLTFSDGAAVIRLPGTTIARQQSEFQMPCTISVAGDIGIPYVDGSNIVDGWARLAEQFPYEEFVASCSAPEHEITHINVIDVAATPPSYDNICLLGACVRGASQQTTTLGQLSAFVDSAIDSSHSFPGLLAKALLNDRYGVGAMFSPLQVDTASFDSAAAWCRGRGYFWDGALPEPVNIRQWGNDTAALFLLDLVPRNGVCYLEPAILFDEEEAVGESDLVNMGTMVPGSFSETYFPQQERQPIRVSVRWREQRQAEGDGSNRGMFPVIREVTVREAGTPANAPLETIDMSEFSTSETHAIDVAKSKCRLKRLCTHQVRYAVIPQRANFSPARCFRLAAETVSYVSPRNGAILDDGTIISNPALSDGTYNVLLQGGGATQETQITVVNGRAINQASAMFTVAELAATEKTCKVSTMGFNDNGDIDVTALYWPTDSSRRSLVSAGWDVAANWVIEGAVGSGTLSGSLAPSFSGASITGPGTLTVGTAASYSVIVSGTGTGFTYSWSGTGLTFGSASSAVTTITASSAGNKIASCTVSRGGVTFTSTHPILAAAATGTTTIGSVTVSGSSGGASPLTANYSAAISGTASDLIYGWSAPKIPSAGTVAFSSASAPTVTAVLTGAGTYALQCRVSSYGATDRMVERSCTFTLAADTCNATAHGLAVDDEITFSVSSGTLPTPLLERTPYYVLAGGLTANALTLALVPGGAAVDLGGTASGAYTLTRTGKTDLIEVVVT
jgi:hypothetical protein